MRREGITLIELVIVIAIIGILATVSGFEFSNWIARYRVEVQVRDMYADISGARQRAMQKNMTYFMHLNASAPDEYATYEDSNSDNSLSIGTDLKVDSLSRDRITGKSLKYKIMWNGGGTSIDIRMDKRGLVDVTPMLPNRSLWLLKDDGTTYNYSEVEYDCLNIHETKIRMGKFNGTSCQPK
jgi:prepilin-type N-terminal cleavage/methylation domain-containing protein